MRVSRNHVLVAISVLAIGGIGSCVVLGWLLGHRLRIEASLRSDPAGLAIHRGETVPDARPRLLVLGDSRASHLAGQPFSPWSAINRGIPGQTASEVLARGARDLVLLAPDQAVLIVGINDLKTGDADTTVDRAAASIEELARVAQTLRIPLLIVEVWREGDVFEARSLLLPSDLDTRVAALNERIRGIAAETDARCLPTDFLLDDSGRVRAENARDTLHLSDDGNALLAATIASSINTPTER